MKLWMAYRASFRIWNINEKDCLPPLRVEIGETGTLVRIPEFLISQPVRYIVKCIHVHLCTFRTFLPRLFAFCAT